MKIPLELNCVEDGRIFLNFWDHVRGRDVTCEVRQGRLYLQDGEEQDDEHPLSADAVRFVPEQELSLMDFIERVIATVD